MSKLLLAIAIALAGAGSLIASQETEVMAPVRQFIDGFNKGDIEMAQAACADQTVIIDDFPPHEWRGPEAASIWFRNLTDFGKKYDMSEAFVSLNKPRHVQITGPHAYAVVPINLSYKDKGQLVKRTGLITLALEKTEAGWRIAALAWTWGEN